MVTITMKKEQSFFIDCVLGFTFLQNDSRYKAQEFGCNKSRIFGRNKSRDLSKHAKFKATTLTNLITHLTHHHSQVTSTSSVRDHQLFHFSPFMTPSQRTSINTKEILFCSFN